MLELSSDKHRCNVLPAGIKKFYVNINTVIRTQVWISIIDNMYPPLESLYPPISKFYSVLYVLYTLSFLRKVPESKNLLSSTYLQIAIFHV